MDELPSPSSLTLDGASFKAASIAPRAFVGIRRVCLRRLRSGFLGNNPSTTPAAAVAHILQIYKQTDGSYMGSPEMSPLYGIVNALAQTAAAIILFLASIRSCSLPSASLSSPDQSLLLLFLHAIPFLCHGNCSQALHNTYALFCFFAFRVMHIAPLPPAESQQIIAICVKPRSGIKSADGEESLTNRARKPEIQTRNFLKARVQVCCRLWLREQRSGLKWESCQDYPAVSITQGARELSEH